jgi:hypothetical protein
MWLIYSDRRLLKTIVRDGRRRPYMGNFVAETGREAIHTQTPALHNYAGFSAGHNILSNPRKDRVEAPTRL